MPISLIDDETVYTLERQGSRFLYHVAAEDEIARIVRKHTQVRSRGFRTAREQFDDPAATNEILESYVVGWETVLDARGKPISYKANLVAKLPRDVKVDLLDCIVNGPAELGEQAEEEVKNSPSSSSSTRSGGQRSHAQNA